MDTTSITQGEVPTRAYRVDEGVEFNNVEAVEGGNSYSGTDPLLSDRVFGDVSISDSKVVTKVNMSATGNKMTELDFDIMKKS